MKSTVSKMNGFFKLLCLVMCVIQIDSMAIKGPVLTRYVPCGLGVIHFDKISDEFWQAVINLSLYPTLTRDTKVEITFEKAVKVYGTTTSSTFKVDSNWCNFVFEIDSAIPSTYVFYVKLENNETDVPYVSKFALNDQILCNDELKAAHNMDSFNVPNDNGAYAHICGRRSLDHAELTSVRTDSEAGDWPWHVAIMVKGVDTDVLKYECGGSIISLSAVVTAGHCVSKDEKPLDPKRVTVLAGIDNHQDQNQIGRQEFIADEIALHPNYDDIQATSDLAVIKISNLRFTEYVQPICLWGPVYDKSNLFGYPATVVGFGTTEDGKPSDILRSTNILVQNDTTCIKYSPKLYTSLLNEFTFCAGFGPKEGVNGRNGDSGGGLVVPTIQRDHKISWFLRGVLSKCGVPVGASGCDPKFYTVWTDVGPHYGWIYHHSGLQYRDNIL